MKKYIIVLFIVMAFSGICWADVELTWNAPEEMESTNGYNVYRCRYKATGQCTDWKKLNTALLTSDQTSFVDTSHQEELDYGWYVSVAHPTDGRESRPSNTVTIPNVPKVLDAVINFRVVVP